MSNAFTNFLSGAVDGFLGDGLPQMKDYQHADRLYVRDTYARAPKVGFLYFVSFNLNTAVLDPQWAKNGPRTIGLLVKKLDLPKFQIHTETLNQYNRKTVVQTGIKYNPISIDFHDDNSDLTTGLWKNYYQYYYGDGVSKATNASGGGSGALSAISGFVGGLLKGASGPNTNIQIPASYADTKYRAGNINFNYGLNNGQALPFFKSIDIYVLHQHRFSEYTLVNPLITEWTHDTLDQSEGNKTLANRMQVSYESVIYNTGKVKKGNASGSFIAAYYDTSPSPLSVAGGGGQGVGGVLAGAGDVLGDLEDGNYIGALLTGAQVVKNAQQLTSASLTAFGTSILGSTLNNIAANANQGPNAIGNNAINGAIGGMPTSNLTNQTPTTPYTGTGK